MGAGGRLVRIASYLLVSGSLVWSLFSGGHGWRGTIAVVLMAEFVLGWGGVMMLSPLVGMRNAQEALRARLIISGVYLAIAVSLVVALLSSRSLSGLIYAVALLATFREAWDPRANRERLAARSMMTLCVLIVSGAGVFWLVGWDAGAPMLIGVVHFTLLPIADAWLVPKMKMPEAFPEEVPR